MTAVLGKVAPVQVDVFLTPEDFAKASQLTGNRDQLDKARSSRYWVRRKELGPVEGIFDRIEGKNVFFSVMMSGSKLGEKSVLIDGDAWGILELPTQHESIVGDSQEAIELKQEEADAQRRLDEIREKRLAREFSAKELRLEQSQRELDIRWAELETREGNVSKRERMLAAREEATTTDWDNLRKAREEFDNSDYSLRTITTLFNASKKLGSKDQTKFDYMGRIGTLCGPITLSVPLRVAFVEPNKEGTTQLDIRGFDNAKRLKLV